MCLQAWCDAAGTTGGYVCTPSEASSPAGVVINAVTPSPSLTPSVAASPASSGNKLALTDTQIILIAVVGGGGLLIILALIAIYRSCCRKRSEEPVKRRPAQIEGPAVREMTSV